MKTETEKKKLYRVYSGWSKAFTTFSTMEAAQEYATALRKRGVKQVWVRTI